MTFGPGSTYGDEGAGAATSYHVLTWIGIVVALVVLVCWVLAEDRNLKQWTANARRRGAATLPTGREDAMDDPNRQLEFLPLQTHSKRFEALIVGLSIPYA